MRNYRWITLPVAMVAAVMAVGSGRGAVPEKGKPAPAFTAGTLDGKTIALADYRGKSAVILNFFASW